jgi:hypothetical protein
MMHVSWTTLQEQIFAKLRRPYRSEANMNEVGHDSIISFAPMKSINVLHSKLHGPTVSKANALKI